MKNYLLVLVGLSAILVLFTSEIEYSGGSPGGRSGSPGDGGHTCTDCHSGSASQQEGWISSDIPVEGYTAGETYTITATGTHNGVVKFGFELTAEDGSNNKTGTLVISDPVQTKLTNSNSAVTHKSAGTAPSGNMKTWSVNWTAPAEGTGPVTFYSAFNAANGNGGTSGDVIYKSSLAVDEMTAPTSGITLNLHAMTPHIGELMEFRLIDKSNQHEVERLAIDMVASADFSVNFSNSVDGQSYWIDMYADHNGNGYYDGIPTDHAWRIAVNEVNGAVTTEFTHNTNFSEIYWKHMFEMEFHGMTPHIGERLEVRLINQETDMEVGRSTIDPVPSDEFSAFLPFISSGESYTVEFYADHNENGIYDPPPADHSWQMELLDTEGDENADFTHNTNFTTLDWDYNFVFNAESMDPHLTEMFELRIVNQSSLEEIARARLDSIVLPAFSMNLPGLQMGEDYFIDFYADHNGNGSYDPPPADHAWRLELNGVTGDSEITFIHNTNFTDIQWPTTSIASNRIDASIRVYPNPASDMISISFSELNQSVVSVELLASSGVVQRSVQNASLLNRNIKINTDDMASGIYFLKVTMAGGEYAVKKVVIR